VRNEPAIAPATAANPTVSGNDVIDHLASREIVTDGVTHDVTPAGSGRRAIRWR